MRLTKKDYREQLKAELESFEIVNRRAMEIIEARRKKVSYHELVEKVNSTIGKIPSLKEKPTRVVAAFAGA